MGPRSCPHVCARWCASMGVSAERASRCALSVRSAHVCECPCAQAHGREGTRAPVLVSVPVRARVRVRACACARLPEREGTWGRALDHAFAPALYALCLVFIAENGGGGKA